MHYSSKSDNFIWSIGGSIGYQTYNEHSSPLFPNNPDLQNAVLTSSARTIPAFYPGRTASGLVGGADASVEYEASNVFRLGGRASYQHAGDWSEAKGTLFARYIFSGGMR